MNQLINDGGDFKIDPARPGLSNIALGVSKSPGFSFIKQNK